MEQLQPKFRFKIQYERQGQLQFGGSLVNKQRLTQSKQTGIVVKVSLNNLSYIYFQQMSDFNKDDPFKKLIDKYSCVYEIHYKMVVLYPSQKKIMTASQVETFVAEVKDYLDQQKIMVIRGTQLHRNDLYRYFCQKIHLKYFKCWRLIWQDDHLLKEDEKIGIDRTQKLQVLIKNYQKQLLKQQHSDSSNSYMPPESQGSGTFFQEDCQDSMSQYNQRTFLKMACKSCLVENDFIFKQGDFVVFHSQKLDTIQQTIQNIRRFKISQLLVDLDEYIYNNTRFIETPPMFGSRRFKPESAQSMLLNCPQILQEVIKLFINTHYHAIKDVTTKSDLYLISLSSFRVSDKEEQFTKHKVALKVTVQGDINKLTKYFLLLDQYFYQKFRFSLVSVDEIRCCKLQSLNKYIAQDLDFSCGIGIHNAQGIGDCSAKTTMLGNIQSSFKKYIFKNQKQIASKLRSKYWVLSPEQQNISHQKMSILIKFSTRFRDQLHQDQLILQDLKFFDSALSFKCGPQTYERVICSALKFCSQMRTLQFQCEGFKQGDEFISHIFIKYFAREIQKSASQTKFFISEKTGKVHRRSTALQSQIVQKQIRKAYEQIIFNLRNFPTVSKIKENPRVRQTKNPESCKLQNFLQSYRYQFKRGVYINLLPYISISKLTFNACFIVDDEVNLQNHPFWKLAQRNGRNPAKLIQKIVDPSKKEKNKDRVVSITIQHSDFIRDAIIWIIGVDRRYGRQRRTEQDCNKVFQDMHNYSNPLYIKKNQGKTILQLNFVFPNHNQDTAIIAAKKILQRLQKGAQDQITSRRARIIQANFYFLQQQYNVNSMTKKRTVINVKDKIKLFLSNNAQKRLNMFYLNEERIQKVTNLNFYKVTYYEQQTTKSLSTLNSFVFNYETSKNNYANKKTPIVICKPKVSSQKQWIFDLRNQVYFTVDNQMEVKTHRTSICKLKHVQTSKILRIIQRYFKNLQYFVMPYPKDIPSNGLLTDYLNFYFAENFDSVPSNNRQTFLKRLKINLQEEKLIECQERMISHISKNNFIEWFLIETYAKELQEIKEKIKKERFQKSSKSND